MTDISRRDALSLAGFSAAAAGLASPADGVTVTATWTRGRDDQRIADLGNGTFLNPIMAGDRPDPAVLKDGKDYYLTFSSFDSYPGVVIWHSQDLVNWRPITAALQRNIGSVWAVSLAKHEGRYFLYVPVKAEPNSIFVTWADKIEGPWSDPIDLGLHRHIDPCHAVGEDGSRWLFLSGGDRVALSPDGLAVAGAVEHVYDPWHYPSEWVVEGFSPEGPKIQRRGDWFYMLTAVGGTAGPPTGHMVIAARSRSIDGPWHNCPSNPLVRTTSATERWWSRGHASLVEGPGGDWWGLYHGYEAGFWTLGRQTLLAPVTWTTDGWPRFDGGDLSAPLSSPRGGKSIPHGLELSDRFDRPIAFGTRWSFFRPHAQEALRARVSDGMLHLSAAGTAPVDSSPLLQIAVDQAYRVECDIDVDAGVTAGLILFYDDRLYCGLGFDREHFVTHQYGQERGRPANIYGRTMRIRLTNDRHIVTYDTSGDGGRSWTRFDRGMEVSGYHHNVRGGFLMLRPGLYSAGNGEARFRNFRYKAL
jgi:beta-xylosidase